MDETQLEIEARYNELLRARAEILAEGNISESEQSKIADQTNRQLRDRDKGNKRNAKSQKDLSAELERSAKSQNKMNSSMKEGGKQAGILSKMMATLKQGYEGIIKPLKAFYDLITMKSVYSFLLKTGAQYSGQMKEMFQATQNLKESIGSLSGSGGRRYRTFVNNLSSSTSALTKAGKSLGATFGRGVADAMKGVTEEIKKMGVAFDATMDALIGAEGEFVLLNKGLGISTEALGAMARGSKDAKGEFTELAVTIARGAKKYGINMKAAGKNVDAALKDVQNFGYMTKKEMAETALYATRLGMEMKDLTSFAEKFDTFEGAAEAVGKLSTAFGVQLDTMDMVMEDNPAKKLDMVRKALEQQGKSMDDILGDKHKAKYLADTIGIPIDKLKELQKTGTDEFGFDSLADDLEGAGDDMTELDALKSIADQMKSLNDAFRDVSGVTSFFGAFKKGFTEQLARTPAYQKMFGTINGALQKFMLLGEKVANFVGSFFYELNEKGENIAPLADIFEGFLEYFNSMGEIADKLMAKDGPLRGFFDTLEAFANGTQLSGDGPNIFDMLLGPFMDTDTGGQGLLNDKIQRGFIKLARILGNALADAFRFIGTQSVKWVDKLFDPKTIEKKVKEDGAADPNDLAPVGQVLLESFMHMMETLWKQSGRIASAIYGYLVGGPVFFGKTVAYKDSVFGKLFTVLKEYLSKPEDWSDTGGMKGVGRDMMHGLFLIMGFDAGADMMANETATMLDGMKLAFQTLKYELQMALGDMMKALADWATAELAKYGNYDEWTDAFNPAVMLLRSMAGMGYQAASSLYTSAGETDDQIKAIQADVAAKQKLYDEMMAGVESLVGAEGNLADAVTKARGLAGAGGMYKVEDTYNLDEGSKDYGKVIETGRMIDLSGDDASVRRALAEIAKSEEYKSGLYNEDGGFIPTIKLDARRAEAQQGIRALEDELEELEDALYAQEVARLEGDLDKMITMAVDNPEFLAERAQLQKKLEYVKGVVHAFHTTETAWLWGQDSAKIVTDQGAAMNKRALDEVLDHNKEYWKRVGIPDPTANKGRQFKKWKEGRIANIESQAYLIAGASDDLADARAKMDEEIRQLVSRTSQTDLPGYDATLDPRSDQYIAPNFQEWFANYQGQSDSEYGQPGPMQKEGWDFSENLYDAHNYQGTGGYLSSANPYGLDWLDWTDGAAGGVSDGFSVVNSEVEAGAEGMEDTWRKATASRSPSLKAKAMGKDWADGLLLGIFGEGKDGKADPTGLLSRFSEQMAFVMATIDDQYKSIGEMSAAVVETKLGKFGQVLRGEKPLHTIIENDKVVVNLKLDVKVDSESLAHTLAEPKTGEGSYFVLNPKRVGSDEYSKLIEDQGKQYGSVFTKTTS